MMRTEVPLSDEIIAFAAMELRNGSKSFNLAARLLSRRARVGTILLYAWCRHCDDVIDGGRYPVDDTSALQRLSILRQKTIWALSGDTIGLRSDADRVFFGLAHVFREFQIPHKYAFELLEGMRMDVVSTRYESMAALLVYCYRVAGVVGLMMAHVLGVSSARAMAHARDLGMAMQLTNIARDVRQDWDMGRIYIPDSLFAESGIGPKECMDVRSRGSLARVVRRLLSHADALYESGDRGLRYLSFREAASVLAARLIYCEIGRKVLHRGAGAWDSRTVVGGARKLFLTCVAVFRVLCSLPDRQRKIGRLYADFGYRSGIKADGSSHRSSTCVSRHPENP